MKRRFVSLLPSLLLAVAVMAQGARQQSRTDEVLKRMPKVATILACLLAATAGIILLLLTPVAAQNDVSAEVDRYIKDEMQKQQIPGLSLAVIKAGRIILAKGYGFANVEHQVPVRYTI